MPCVCRRGPGRSGEIPSAQWDSFPLSRHTQGTIPFREASSVGVGLAPTRPPERGRLMKLGMVENGPGGGEPDPYGMCSLNW